jgi:predicted nucleic acid-binding protein
MAIDLNAVLRRYKPHRRISFLPERDQKELARFDNLRVKAGTRFLLDTGVYIKQAAGLLTDDQRDKLAKVEAHHCAVCLGEITAGLANRDVAHANWPRECEYWAGLFANLPKTRTYAPDAEIWAAAGVLTGTLTRIQGYQPAQRKEVLNDALIYLTALKHGIPVLTENRKDFDRLQQLVPGGRFYLI